MKYNLKKYLLFLFIFGAFACNKKSSSPSGTESQTDINIASAKTAADETADSIAESGTSSSFSPLQNEIEPLTTTITRTCTASGNNATVDIAFSGSDSLSLTKQVGSASVNIAIDVTKTGSEQRVWSPASCLSGTYANVDWASTGATSGLTLAVTLSRTINRSKTITVTKANGTSVTKNAVDNVEVAGSRAIAWAVPTTSGANVLRTKVITSSVTRNLTFTKADGTSSTLSSTVSVDSATPLNVTVERVNSTKALVSKTINSGTVKVTLSGGAYSSCVFSGVKYEFGSNTNKCLPTAGTITCEKFASSSATTAESTTIISFGQSTTSTVSISTDGGSTVEDFTDYNSKGCDLESAS